MKLQGNLTTVERSENFQETKFRVKSSAKAFRILSAGLYSDAKSAILRELGTNAADAMTMAGKPDEPFRVHLPNRLECYLSVSDDGIGLSQEDIEGIYTTYFESNKTSSNLLNGCMGIGGKSPFAYVDNFTVTSRYNGSKFTYTAFIDESGVPSIAHLNTEETQECNGLEISLVVEPQDILLFAEKAKKIYQPFRIKPIIVGQQITFNDTTKPHYEGNGWKAWKGNGQNLCVMGNVSYPINFTQCNVDNQLFRLINVEIAAPIGEVEMTASRESLEYNYRTKDYIKKVADEIVANWEKILLDELAKQPTYWQACEFYNDNKLWIKAGTLWNKRPVEYDIPLPRTYEAIRYEKMYYRAKGRQNINFNIFRVDNKTIFVINDLARGCQTRCLKYVRDNLKARLVVPEFTDATAKKEFFDTLDLPANRVILASKLPKQTYNRSGVPTEPVVYQLRSGNYSKASQSWEQTLLKDVTTKAAYIEMERFAQVGGRSADGLRYVSKWLDAAGYAIPIYGVRKGTLKKVVKLKNFVQLDEYVKKCQEKHQTEEDLILNHEHYLNRRGLLKLKDAMDLDIRKMCDTISYVMKNQVRLKKLHSLMKINKKLDDNDPTETVVKSIGESYPLLKCIMNNAEPDEWPIGDLVNYINEVNSKKGNK